MNYPEKFKQGFIKQIEKELNKCEIIYNPNTKGIWFVNREEKYWYLEYKVDTNYLWWRYEFFKLYTNLFSMPSEVFEKVISEWVENKLNGKVETTLEGAVLPESVVEETLNLKVLKTRITKLEKLYEVEDTLNCKVLKTIETVGVGQSEVEETLNLKVLKTKASDFILSISVEDTLNCKVLSTLPSFGLPEVEVEDTLNLKVLRTMKGYYSNKEKVEDTLNYKVDSTWSLLDDCEDEVEETLN